MPLASEHKAVCHTSHYTIPRDRDRIQAAAAAAATADIAPSTFFSSSSAIGGGARRGSAFPSTGAASASASASAAATNTAVAVARGANSSIKDRGAPGSNSLRAMRWSTAWRLPNNQRAYETLCLKRVPPHLAGLALAPLGPYALFDKFRRAVMRTWSCLAQHEPALQDTPTTAWVALAMHWSFPHNQLLCLEASMHVLANTLPIRPDAPVPRSVVDMVVGLIDSKRATLTAKWARLGVDPAEIIAPLFENLAVPIFGEALWPQVFGACCVGGEDVTAASVAASVLDPSSAFILFIAAVLLLRAPLCEKAPTRQRLLESTNSIFQQDGGATVLRQTSIAMARLVKDLLPVMVMLGPSSVPRRSMVTFAGSDDSDYYPPLLNPDDEPARNVTVSVPEFLQSIEKHEVELAKRGVAKTEALGNAGEAIAWSRALRVQQQQQQQPNLAVLEAELARRNVQKMSGSARPMLEAAAAAGHRQQQQQQQQQQHSAVGGSYPEEMVAYPTPNAVPVVHPSTAHQQQQQQQHHHRSVSDSFDQQQQQSRSASVSFVGQPSPVRPPFVVVPPNAPTTATSKGQATLVKTELPPSRRAGSTQPRSSVDALLRLQDAQRGRFQQPSVLVSSPTSSSNPSGVVNSPARRGNSPPRPPAFMHQRTPVHFQMRSGSVQQQQVVTPTPGTHAATFVRRGNVSGSGGPMTHPAAGHATSTRYTDPSMTTTTVTKHAVEQPAFYF